MAALFGRNILGQIAVWQDDNHVSIAVLSTNRRTTPLGNQL
jgi:hypothetical protein